jgi:hypothetical protein
VIFGNQYAFMNLDLRIFNAAKGNKYMSTKELDSVIAQEYPLSFPTFKPSTPTISKVIIKIQHEARATCINLTIETTLMNTTVINHLYFRNNCHFSFFMLTTMSTRTKITRDQAGHSKLNVKILRALKGFSGVK